MFGLITLDRQTYLIVKKESIKNGGLPSESPFETYGFIYRQEGKNGQNMFSIITKHPEVEAEQTSLLQEIWGVKPLFKDTI